MQSIESKISKDIVISAVLNFSSRIRDIVMIPVLTAGLSISEYGIYVQFLTVTSLAMTVSSFGLVPGYINLSQDSQRNSIGMYYAVLLVLIISSSFIGLIIYLNAEAVSKLTLNSRNYSSVFVLSLVMVPSMVLAELGRGHYRAQMRNRSAALLQAVPDYARLVVVLIVLYSIQPTVEKIILGVVSVEIIFALSLQGLIIVTEELEIPALNQLREVFEYSLWLAVTSYASQVTSRADRLLIGFFIGASAVGMYSIAYGFASLLLVFVTPIRNVFFPEFSRLMAEGDDKKVGKFTTISLHYVVAIGLPSVFGLLFVSEPLLKYFVSPIEASQTAQLVPIVSFGILFFGITQLQSVTLFSARNVKPVVLTRGTAAIGNIGLNIAVIPHFGVVGAAVATVVTYLMSSLNLHRILQQRFPVGVHWRRLIAVGLSTVGMTVFLSLLPFIHVVVTILMGVVVYSFLMLLLGGVEVGSVKTFLREYN